MPTTPLLARDAVRRLLPQQAPMVMVHELTAISVDLIESSFTVEEGDVFLENGALLEGGVIENVAQTAALGQGWEAATRQAPPPVGYIGAVGRLTIRRLPLVGETLRTSVRITHRIGDVQVLQGEVRVGDPVIAEMELKVFNMSAADAR